MNTQQSKTRFVAEWIVAQHFNEIGDYEPYRDEYGESTHATLEAAQAAAIASSKAAGVAEWVAVREQRLETHDSEGRPWRRWETVRRWYGDYEQWDDASYG
jgi:hypothetical protein